MCRSTGIIESGENAWGALLLDKIADNLVVEVFDWRPLDLFSDILLLLRFQCEFNKDLLKFLIDVVDAKLLKRVIL